MPQVKQRYLNCMCIFLFLSYWLLEYSVFNETFPQESGAALGLVSIHGLWNLHMGHFSEF